MLLDPDEKVEPLPVQDLLRKGPRKRLWDNLIPSSEPSSTAEASPATAKKAVVSQGTAESGSQSGSQTVQRAESGSQSDLKAVHKSFKGSQSGSNRGSQVVQVAVQPNPNSEPTPQVVAANSAAVAYRKPFLFFHLSRNRIATLAYIYNLCRQYDDVTPPLHHKAVSAELNLPFETLRTCLKRLCADNLLQKLGTDRGRNAHHQYKLTETFFKVLKIPANREILLSAGQGSAPTSAYFSSQRTEFNSGSHMVQTAVNDPLCSSSNLETTTTSEPHSLASTDVHLQDQINTLNLASWGISQRHLYPFVGPGKICETFEDLEELLHRAAAAIDSIEQGGKKIRSRAGFLISRLKGEPIGVPDGYVALKEKRLIAEKEQKGRELQNLRKAKREKLLVEFELFKEQIDPEEKKRLITELRAEETKNLGTLVGQETIERTVLGRFRESLIKRFCEPYAAIGEAKDVEVMLQDAGV